MLRKNVFKDLKENASGSAGGFVSPASISQASMDSPANVKGTLNRMKWSPNTLAFVSIYGENDPWGAEDTSFTKSRFMFSESLAVSSKFGEGDFWSEEGVF